MNEPSNTGPPPEESAFGETWPLAQPATEAPAASAPAAVDVLSLLSYQLLARARRLSVSNATDRQLSVILAMSACDLHLEQTLVNLMRHRGTSLDAVESLQGHRLSLANSRAQKAYAVLTRDVPWGDPSCSLAPVSWWADWHATQELRQRVAQSGAPVSAPDAARCTRSCVSFMAHVSDQLAKATARPR